MSRLGARSRNRRRETAVAPRERLGVLLGWLSRAVMPVSTALALLALAVLADRGISALYAQPVSRITVAGKLEAAHRDAVRSTVAERIDAGLLGLDLDMLREELEALPWIYRASLRRRFPDTLEIHVIEQLPIARWGDEGFLNHEARVVAVADASEWDDLPQIRGPEGSEARLMARYQRLLDLLRPLEMQPASLEEDPFGQVTVMLDNGIELALGDHDFPQRMEDFLTLWRRELREQSARVVRVDMRYAAGAAVAFREQPQLAGLAADSQDG
jgi:cell division protein FtsQ